MMKKTFVLLSALLSLSAMADDQRYHLSDDANSFNLEFAAPVVQNTSGVSDKVIGTIVYDASSDQFKGLDRNGNWDAMSIGAGNSVNLSTTSGVVEHIQRARISNSGSCSVVSQSGSWVASLTRPTTGQCTWTYAAGTFSATPSCTCTAESSGAICTIQAISSTSVTIWTGNTTTAIDEPFAVNCMGPQ